MAIIDFILNIVGLLLWLNWRAVMVDPLAKRTPLTLVGTLKGAQPNRVRQWQVLVVLGAVLFLRAVLYWQIGPSADWTPRIDLFFIVLAFRADVFGASLFFSVLSFVRALVIFYFWMLALTFLNRAMPESEPVHRLLKAQLGPISTAPRILQILIPVGVVIVLWGGFSPVLAKTGIIEPAAVMQVLKQGLLVSGSLFLSLKYLLPAFLLLHLVLTYVYLGQSPVLEYVSATARRLTSPFKILPLGFGRIDLAPIVSAVVILLVLDALPRYLLVHVYPRTSVWPQ